MDNKINSEIMNEYFVNITQNMGIPKFNEETLTPSDESIDPVDEIIYKFSKHPSIIKINNIVEDTQTFSFNEIDQVAMEK